MKHRLHIFSLVLAVVLLLPLPVRAITSSYYSTIDGKKETALRNALYTITSAGPANGHNYNNLWTAYKTTDVYPSDSVGKAGKIWDMYSDCLFTPGASSAGGDQCGNYDNVCDCYNREHSLPKSWFNDATPAYYDMGHIVPTDGKTNGMRSNYVFGECANGYKTWGTGKLGSAKAVETTNVKGSSTITTTFTGTAFEPADKYKGDFARMYMYMIVRYKYGNSNSITFTESGTEGSTMFNDDDTNYGLTDYSVALLMKWHRQDPVSQKEINRNNGMESVQGNRNPFIDYPCLAEYLWGSKAGETVTLSELEGTFTGSWTSGDGCPCEGPTITLSTSSLAMDATAPNSSSTKTFTVTGADLTSKISITNTSGDGCFSVSPSNITTGYNGTTTITVTYSPTAEGSHEATFTIASTGATSKTVTVSGTCTTVYNVTWRADDGTNPYHSNTAASGSKPTLPSENPDDCSTSRVFMGWTDDSDYSGDGSDLFTDSEDAPLITSATTFYAVYADKETSGGGGSSSSASYTFSNKSWAASPSNWTSGKDGNGFSNSGVQVTTGVSGANATCPTSYNSISSIVISYCTNASKGAGSIQMTVGSTSVSNNVSTSGGTTARDLTFDFSSTKPSGAPQITVTCTTNSIYICGVTITYGGGGSTTYSNYSTQCTACTPVAATASYAYPTRTTTCGGSVSNAFTTNSNATVSYTSTNTSVATVASDGTVTPVGQGSATITATVPANTCFTGGASASFTLTVNRNTGTASFSGATTTVNKDATVTNVVTTNSDGAVTYSSSNTSVATVNASGVVTGVSAGTATITANVAQSTCYTAASANYTITVYDFKANAATDVTCESFTANWNTSGAASYSLDVYQGTTSSTTVSRDTTISYDFVSALTWTSQYVSGTSNIWSHNTTYGAYGKGASGTASESWLISPELDFSDVTTASLTMNHTFRYGESSQLSVKYSTDGGSTWSDASLSNWGSKDSWAFVDATADLSATCGSAHVKLAFVYTCTISSYATWEIKTLSITGTYDKTISTSSVEHVSGYPKNVSGTSASVTGLDASTTYKYTVTPLGGSASNEIEVTTPACSCTRTITATTADDSMGTVDVTVP